MQLHEEILVKIFEIFGPLVDLGSLGIGSILVALGIY